MNYDEIEHLRANHPAWSLLRSQNVALVMSFLGRVFVDRNVADVPAGELAGELDDELYALNQRLGEDRFPRPAVPSTWTSGPSPERGWLRKFYPPGSDEARYDISPAVEKALLWVQGPARPGVHRHRVPAQHHLRPAAPDGLRRRGGPRAPLGRAAPAPGRDRRGDRPGRAGRGRPCSTRSASRDRYQQFARTARELLADFRQVEENFRRLDREPARADRRLDRLQGRPARRGSRQPQQHRRVRPGPQLPGLLRLPPSHQRQAELTELLDRLREIDVEIGDLDDRLATSTYDWIDASERTQATVRLLSEQLRRFLDDQVWLENRRVFDLLRSIEAKALASATAPRRPAAHDGDRRHRASSSACRWSGPCTAARPRSRSTAQASRRVGGVRLVRPGEPDVCRPRPAGAPACSDALGPQDQVGLHEVLAEAPLEQGLAELIGYLSLAEPGLAVVFDDAAPEQIQLGRAEDDAGRAGGRPAPGHLQPGPDGGSMSAPRAGTTHLTPSDLSVVVINLMKGPLYRDTHERPWARCCAHRAR